MQISDSCKQSRDMYINDIIYALDEIHFTVEEPGVMSRKDKLELLAEYFCDLYQSLEREEGDELAKQT